MPTIAEIEAQIATLNAQKMQCELEEAATLIPIYKTLADRMAERDVGKLHEDMTASAAGLPEGSVAAQQVGHLGVVLQSVQQYFSQEAERLSTLVTAAEEGRLLSIQAPVV